MYNNETEHKEAVPMFLSSPTVSLCELSPIRISKNFEFKIHTLGASFE